MNKTLKLTLLSLLTLLTLNADGYKIEVAKTLDSNAKQQYFPDLVLPMQWNDSFSSSVEYRSGELTDYRTDSEYTTDESIKHQRFRINALNFNFGESTSNYSLGIGLSYETFAKEQVGTYNTTSIGTGNYTNDINIDYLTLYIKMQTIQKFNFIDLKLYALVIPVAKLDVTQNTKFTGDTNVIVTDNSSESQNFTYEIDLNFVSNSGTFIDLGFNSNYRILPLKYGLSGSNIDYEETIIRLQATLLFNIEIFNGWMPSLAYSTENTSSDTAKSSLEETTERKVYLGIHTRF